MAAFEVHGDGQIVHGAAAIGNEMDVHVIIVES
jgi:hypothetical protein